jgi:hypothetical protein
MGLGFDQTYLPYDNGKSKKELDRNLPYTRIPSRDDFPKYGGVQNIAAWIVELCVIKDVEELEAKFQPLGFPQAPVFQERQIPVIDAGAVKKTPLRVAQLPQGFDCE